MSHHTPMKPRTVRCIETGQTLTVSSSKAKRLVKLGGYEEVSSHKSTLEQARTPLQWRMIGIVAAVCLALIATTVWLRLVNFI